MTDLIIRDQETGEELVLIRTSMAIANANELGAQFNILEIHGLAEENLDTDAKKNVNYTLDKGKNFTLAQISTLAAENSLSVYMRTEDGETLIPNLSSEESDPRKVAPVGVKGGR